MAAVNAWVHSTTEAGKRENPSKVSGGRTVTIAGTFEVAAADDDGSIYKLAKLPANAIPVKAEIFCDAITSGTDYDLGLYNEDGTVADKDILADGLDMSSAAAITAPKNGLANLGGADPLAAYGKKLWELLGLTVDTKKPAYILALTANTVGSAAGTISYRLTYILG